MEYVDFLLFASPEGSERARGALAGLLRRLNERDQERRYELTVIEASDAAEGVSPDAVAERMRAQELRDRLRHCRGVWAVAGPDAREGFLRELDGVLDAFRDGEAPEIEAYAAPEAEEMAFRLAVRLRDAGAPCHPFTHPDAVALDLLLSLDRRGLADGTLSFRDGEALLDETPVLSLEHVPVYAENEALRQARAEKARLDEDLARLRRSSQADPEDGVALSGLLEASRERGRAAGRLHEMEDALLGLCQSISGRQEAGPTWRERQAGRLMDAGDYLGALTILRDEGRAGEMARAERIRQRSLRLAEKQLDKVRGCIREDRLKIAALRAGDAPPDLVAESWAQTARLAEQYHVEMDVLYDFADFLWEQQSYEAAVRTGERLAVWYDQAGASPEDRAALEDLLGNCLFDQEDLAGAEAHYRAALELYRTADGDLAADEATTLSDLAALTQMNGRMEEAEDLYRDALDLRRDLSERDPKKYAALTAETCVRLANLVSAAGGLEEAEELYREALSLSEGPGADAYAAAAGYDLGKIQEAQGRTKEAEKSYRDALDRSRRLSEEDPESWAADTATICGSLAALLDRMGRGREARPLYAEALGRARDLAEEDPESWAAEIASDLTGLAVLSKEAGEDATALYEEALGRCRALEEDDPASWKEETAELCAGLAELLRDAGRVAEAEPLAKEGLGRARALAERDPAWDPDVAQGLRVLSGLLRDEERPDEAVPLAREALDRYRDLEEGDPAAYGRSVASSCGELAALLKETGREQEAEGLYREALDRFRALGGGGSPDEASACRDLADLLADTGRPQEAERLYCEALDIYRKLAEKRPAVWEPEVALTSNNLAVFLKGAGRPEAADWFYRVALDSYRKLAKRQPESYAPYVAATCDNLAQLLYETGRMAEAERFYRVALDAFRKLADREPDAYEPIVAETCGHLGVFLLAVKHDRREARSLFQEAASLYGKWPGHEREAEDARRILEGDLREEPEEEA